MALANNPVQWGVGPLCWLASTPHAGAGTRAAALPAHPRLLTQVAPLRPWPTDPPVPIAKWEKPSKLHVCAWMLPHRAAGVAWCSLTHTALLPRVQGAVNPVLQPPGPGLQEVVDAVGQHQLRSGVAGDDGSEGARTRKHNDARREATSAAAVGRDD